MNRYIPILAMLVLAGCQAREAGQPGRVKTMMIKAAGEVETLPDMATFSIRLDCLQKSVKASKECLVEKSNELNKRLLGFGLLPQDILTTSVDMHKSYSWNRNSRVFEGYNSSTTLYITVKELDKLDEIYTELLENRNLEIGSLAYSHSRIDSLQNEAYLSALTNAGKLADKLLQGLPEKEKEILKLGNVKITSSVPEPTLNQMEEADGMAVAEVAAQKRSVAISKGTVLVRANLYVEYRIR